MKIATWNINSVRLRLDNIKKLKESLSPDIICLQETKVEDSKFPLNEIQDLGYEHCYFLGQKSYNGVAILSKIKPKNTFSIKLVNDDTRHIAITLDNDIEIHNFYVHSGGDIPDINENKKFADKLSYLDAMEDWFLSNRKKSDKLILVGDLNISPYEHDVWSSYQLRNEISHTMIEREKLIRLLNSINFIDIARVKVPYSEKLYSWWSYRNRDWQKSNRGRRLDHIWATDPIKDFKNFEILKEARSWDKPSDHVPVFCEFNS
jgi:exodeoxyribonuclease-3